MSWLISPSNSIYIFIIYIHILYKYIYIVYIYIYIITINPTATNYHKSTIHLHFLRSKSYFWRSDQYFWVGILIFDGKIPFLRVKWHFSSIFTGWMSTSDAQIPIPSAKRLQFTLQRFVSGGPGGCCEWDLTINRFMKVKPSNVWGYSWYLLVMSN